MAGSIKQRVLAKDVISVCNADFPTPAMVEFIGELGFDVLFVDCEQSSTDFALVEELGRAARLAEHDVRAAAVEQRGRSGQSLSELRDGRHPGGARSQCRGRRAHP